MAMLELKNVHKSFGNQEILKGVGLSVNKGDVVAILGPSGSGKTTLLRIADFLETADQGQMRFDGDFLDLTRLQAQEIARIRRKTGFVFQNYNLFRNLTALENITVGLRVVRGMDAHRAREIGLAALEDVGLLDRASYYPSSLSGGQQQRVGIARAIAANPEVIYLDEPTSALDPELVGEVLSVIRKLAAEGRTMVLVTHELNFARHVATHVVLMADGVVVEENDPEEFFTHPRHERTRQFLKRLDEPTYCREPVSDLLAARVA